MRKIFLLIAIVSMFINAEADTYKVGGDLATTLSNAGITDATFTSYAGNTSFYYIDVPRGFSVTSGTNYKIIKNDNRYGAINASANSWTPSTLGFGIDPYMSASVNYSGTFYGITLYVDGSNSKLYFSTNSVVRVLTPDNFINNLNSTAVNPIVGTYIVGTEAAGYRYRYRLTFPGTNITWNQAKLPIGSITAISTTIGSKEFSATSATGSSNSLKVYGVYGQEAPTISYEWNGNTYSKTLASDDWDYFGKTPSELVNYVNITAATSKWFTTGKKLVTTIAAVDNATSGYEASFYVPYRAASLSGTPTIEDFSTGITAGNKYEITNIDVMKSHKLFKLDPSFNDLYATNVESLPSVIAYYIPKPHYLMVTVPFKDGDDMNANFSSISGNEGVLALGTSSAPALNLEKIGSAKIKAVTGSYLYNTAIDVAVTDVSNDNSNLNYSSVDFANSEQVTTGVEGVAVANVSIVGGEGMITISGATNGVIYDITGRTVASVNGDNTVNVPAGVYIVKAGTITKKVAVK
ncbi:MAG: hypothetical protein LKF31_04030 [Muribaculaceae bacterium]|jgi:hypothetical protein|nr:hypothetical protein [Muribaculaceae bacterium]